MKARQESGKEWTSEGEQKGDPEYVRRSRPSVIKGPRMDVRSEEGTVPVPSRVAPQV